VDFDASKAPRLLASIYQFIDDYVVAYSQAIIYSVDLHSNINTALQYRNI
jgi:hypothetical protein